MSLSDLAYELFTVAIHHRGNWVYLYDEKKYENGEITYFDYCDWDLFSRFTLEEMAIELGYELPMGFWWRPLGNLVNKGGMLSCDDSIRAMIFDMDRREYRQVDVFLVPPDPSTCSGEVKKTPIPACTIEELPDDAEVVVDVVVNPLGYPEGGVHVENISDSTDGEEDQEDQEDEYTAYREDEFEFEEEYGIGEEHGVRNMEVRIMGGMVRNMGVRIMGMMTASFGTNIMGMKIKSNLMSLVTMYLLTKWRNHLTKSKKPKYPIQKPKYPIQKPKYPIQKPNAPQEKPSPRRPQEKVGLRRERVNNQWLAMDRVTMMKTQTLS